MADLSDQEEFELLTLERQRAGVKEPSTLEKVSQGLNAAAAFSPMGMIAKGGSAALKTLDEMAYEAGGRVTDATGSPAAGTAVNAALSLAPGGFGGATVARGAAPMLESGAKGLMQQALRPTLKDQRLGKADRAAQTLLDEGVNVTKGGVEKLRTMGTDLNTEVDKILNSSGATIDKNAVASRLQDVIARIERNDWTPAEGRAAVEKVYDEFIANPLIPKNITLQVAQTLKQGIYKKLKDKYGTLGSDTVEANKAGARGFKEELESAAPEVAPLNARASDIWNALNVAERRAMMAANNQVGGIAWLAHSPLTWAASMADRSSLAKSLMARGLYNGSEAIPTAAGAAGGATLAEILRRHEQK